MEPFWATIIVAILSSCIPAYASIRINKANNATNLELIRYRMDQLEKKVDKHNSVIERTFMLEKKLERIDTELSRIKYKKS